jgi:uncharacterized protein YciI
VTRYVLLYESAPDVTVKAPLHFPAHWSRCQQFHADGTLLLIGPFANTQAHGAMGIFTTHEAAQQFADGDPFILNRVVQRWEIREWKEALQPDGR